jgi:hypothetical protein
MGNQKFKTEAMKKNTDSERSKRYRTNKEKAGMKLLRQWIPASIEHIVLNFIELVKAKKIEENMTITHVSLALETAWKERKILQEQLETAADEEIKAGFQIKLDRLDKKIERMQEDEF